VLFVLALAAVPAASFGFTVAGVDVEDGGWAWVDSALATCDIEVKTDRGGDGGQASLPSLMMMVMRRGVRDV
jgi:hypothetical protein